MPRIASDLSVDELLAGFAGAVHRGYRNGSQYPQRLGLARDYVPAHGRPHTLILNPGERNFAA